MNSITRADDAVGGMKQDASPARLAIDAPTRMFHWLLALCFAGAWLTSDGESLRGVHAVLGYTMVGLLAFRLVYGLVGPKQARLAALARRAAGAPRWLRETWRAATAPGHPGVPGVPGVNWPQGLGMAMSAIAVAMLLLPAPLALSGLATLDEWGGHRIAELTEELHEFAGNLLLALVLAHLGLLVVLSALRRRNEAARMVTGRIAGRGPDIARHNHAWLVALLLLGVLAYWVMEALGASWLGLLAR